MALTLVYWRYKITIPFGDGEYKTVYELTFQRTYLWGLFKRFFKKDYTLTMFDDSSSFQDHWDTLITNKIHLK